MCPQANKQIHLVVSGRVQGAGFRYFTYESALQFGITGWVRNRPDRRVEILASGTEENLEQFLREVHRGPNASQVDSVEVSSSPINEEFQSFDIKLF
ncbi:MAG: acylphosphatase [Anaerolineales bacterium]|nr:acylphosphatase [Anaerolineales bacterium]